MIGLDYLMAGYIQLADFKLECKLKKAPQITVAATAVKTVINEKLSVKELSKKDSDTISPYAPGTVTITEGLTDGVIRMSAQTMFQIESYPKLNSVCLYVDKVNVKFEVEPSVYIASDYKKGSCQYKAVMEHEQKHVKVDRVVVNKYSNIISRAVDNTMKHVGYAQGPYDLDQLPALKNQIGGIINSVVGQYYENMNLERRAMQQGVDSLEEYTRVDKLCPD